MRLRTLRPNEVTPAQEQAVLEFLNSALTAEEIAIATDIPGVHDIGIRLADRILARRHELGGFTSVAELLEIPLIGPIRFTHIIHGLAGPGDRKRPTWTGDESLRSEIRELRTQLGALLEVAGRKPRLTIRALQAAPFLGEGVNLLIDLRSPEGIPLGGVPLTLTTTWGVLRTRRGAREMRGTSVTTTTDAEGRARAIFRPATTEPLNELQQSNLSFALSRLDREAPTPRHAAADLRRLSTDYRAPGNESLREAMDLYFRDFGAPDTEQINIRDPLLEWDSFDATILAFSHAEPEGSADSGIDSIAALNLKIRNWIAPWLEFLHKTVQEQSHLQADLNLALRSEAQTRVIGTIYKRLRDFLDDEPGRAGAFVGRRVAEIALADFVEVGIRELPLQSQITLAPALQTISENVRSAGPALLAANHRMQTELTREVAREVDDRIGTLLPPNWIDDLQSELGRLGDQLNTKLDHTHLDRLRIDTERAFQQQIDTRVDALLQEVQKGVRSEIVRLEGLLENRIAPGEWEHLQNDLRQALGKEAESRLGEIRIELRQELDSRFSTLTQQVEGMVHQEQLDGLHAEWRQIIDKEMGNRLDEVRLAVRDDLTADIALISQRLEGKVGQERLGAMHIDLQESFAKEIDSRLGELHLGLRKEIDGELTKLSQQLEGKVGKEQFDRLQIELRQVLGKEADTRLDKIRFEVREEIGAEIIRLSQQLESKVSQGDLQRVRGELQQALHDRVAMEELNALRVEMNDALAQRVPLDRFAAHEKRVDSALLTKADVQSVETLDRNIVALDKNVLALQSATSDVTRNVARIDDSVGRLHVDVRTIKRIP